MKPFFFVAFALAFCVVLALCEVSIVWYRPRWARYVGYSVASFSGDLGDRHAGVPSEVAGLDVHRLDGDTYLVEPRDFQSGGSIKDANLAYLAHAILDVHGQGWTMNVRTSVGYSLLPVVLVALAIVRGTTQPLSTLGRLFAVALAVAAAFAAVTWPKKVRARFAPVAQMLSASQPEGVPAATRSL